MDLAFVCVCASHLVCGAFHSSQRELFYSSSSECYQSIRSTEIIISPPRFQHRSLTAYRIIFRSSLDGFFWISLTPASSCAGLNSSIMQNTFYAREKNLSHIGTNCSALGRWMEKLFLCMLHNRYHNLIPGSLLAPVSGRGKKSYSFLLRLKIQNIFLLSPCSSVRVSDKWFLLIRQSFVYSSFSSRLIIQCESLVLPFQWDESVADSLWNINPRVELETIKLRSGAKLPTWRRDTKYEALIGHGLMNFLIKLHRIAAVPATDTKSQSNNIIVSTEDLKFPRTPFIYSLSSSTEEL